MLLSVAELLRREGRRGPHAATGTLVPRGHPSFPSPTLSAPRRRGVRRTGAVTGALLATGAVLGAAVLAESVRLPMETPLVAPPGPGDAAAGGGADGRGAATGPGGPGGLVDLAAASAGLGERPRGDVPGGGAGDPGGFRPVGPATDLAADLTRDLVGTPAAPAGAPSAPGTGGTGPGTGGALPPGAAPGTPDGPAPGAGSGPGSITVIPPAVTTPGVSTPTLPVGGPEPLVTVSPGALRPPSVTLDVSGRGPLLDTGPAAITAPEVRTSAVGPLGRAAISALEAELDGAGGTTVSAVAVGTPDLELGGTTVAVSDLATPELSVSASAVSAVPEPLEPVPVVGGLLGG